MKKLAIAALIGATFVATPALADTTLIYAYVPPVCSIDGPPNNGSVDLNGGTTALGDVTAQCNNAAGFTVQISSLHNFNLVDQDNPANGTTYAYQLNIAGLSPITSNQPPIDSNSFGANGALITPQSAPVSVTTLGASGPAYAGYYQDTITWTITAL